MPLLGWYADLVPQLEYARLYRYVALSCPLPPLTCDLQSIGENNFSSSSSFTLINTNKFCKPGKYIVANGEDSDFLKL